MSLMRRWLEFYGWRPMELARKAGITPQTVNSLLEDGVIHQHRTVVKYAPIFGLSVAEFLAGPSDDTPGGANTRDTREALESYSLSPEDILRARAIRILCSLPPDRLERAAGYLEGLAEMVRKNVSQAS